MPLLHILVKPSRLLIALLVTLHALAILATVLSGLSLPWRAALLVLVFASLSLQLRHHLWRRGACAVAEMILDPNRQWTLQMTDGRLARAELERSQVFRYLVILRFKSRSRRCTVLVPADALDGETHRRLRVALLQERNGERPG